MTLIGNFRADPDVDFLKDEIQPIIIIDGVEAPVGVYRVATINESVTGSTHLQTVEAYDRCILLSWAKVESRDVLAAGQTYTSAIMHYLTATGVAIVSMTKTDATLQTDRTWDIGTSYLEIVNELLDEIGYDHIWFDGSGAARLHPYSAPNASNIRFAYGANAFRLVANDFTRETDIYSKPNVFIVIMSSVNSDPLIATAVNDSPLSELSTIRRGIRIPKVTYVDNVAGQAELQAYANMLRSKGMESAETVIIDTAIQTDHGVGDSVAITDERYAGIYRETGWSITMAAGTQMQHTLRRTVYV